MYTYTYIKHNGEKIVSTDTLKILGFTFRNTPSVRPHVDNLVKKAKMKLWTLRHAKKAGVSGLDL